MAFTCTSLPLNLYTTVFGCCCGFGFEQKFCRIDRFGEKRQGSADLQTHIHPAQNAIWNDVRLLSLPEQCQREISQILRDLDGFISVIYDMLVIRGKTQEEHERILKDILKNLRR